jgi:hypothetical protein
MPRKAIAQQLELGALLPKSGQATTVRPSPNGAGARSRRGAPDATPKGANGACKPTAAGRPSSADLLSTPGALLTRSHLRQLGLERRAIDAVFRSLPVVALPGYSRPMIRAEQFLELVDQHTYGDDRVRPCHA